MWLNKRYAESYRQRCILVSFDVAGGEEGWFLANGAQSFGLGVALVLLLLLVIRRGMPVSDAVAPLDVTAERGKNVAMAATKHSWRCWAVYKSRLANTISGGNSDRMTMDCILHSLARTPSWTTRRHYNVAQSLVKCK